MCDILVLIQHLGTDNGCTWQNLGLIEETKISRSLPWRHPTNVFRLKEDVRPIFWYATFETAIFWTKIQQLIRDAQNLLYV